MADAVEFSIRGLDPLLDKLKRVQQEVVLKGGRLAVRRAAQIVRDAARANARAMDDPATAANIAANIVERFSPKRFRANGDIMFRVGVLGGAGGNVESKGLDSLPGKDTRHWRYVEFGTEKTPARPFMRPALESNIGAATNEIVDQLEKAIDRAIKRGAS
jgi:HK97 gp10 family phage protein